MEGIRFGISLCKKDEDYCYVGCVLAQSSIKARVFQRSLIPPSSGYKSEPFRKRWMNIYSEITS
jgi:hypothetical protein